MRKSLLSILFLASAFSAAWAQKAPPAPVFNSPTPLFQMGWSPTLRTNSSGQIATEIISRSAFFDLKTRIAVYRGDVKVKDAQMDLACELLTVRLSAQNSGRFESIIAETNVVIDFVDEKGQKVHGKGGKAIYTYSVKGNVTNDTIRLFDNPVLETATGELRGDVITFDRANNLLRAINPRTLIRESATTNGGFLAPIK